MRCTVRALICGAISAASLSTTQAAVIFDFDNAFSGSPPAQTNTPWLEAQFQDVTPGTVRLTVLNLGLSGSENIDQLYFNLATNMNPLALSFSGLSISGADLPLISLGTNQFKADGDGKYDVLLDFAQGGTITNRFDGTDTFSCLISGIPGLTANDFNYLSFPAGGAGPFFAAGHVQRIGEGSLSGWISATSAGSVSVVPEPNVASFFGLIAGLWVAERVIRHHAKQSKHLQPARIPSARRRTALSRTHPR
jgi:hypothetical protein